jgi:hypothetical protein
MPIAGLKATGITDTRTDRSSSVCGKTTISKVSVLRPGRPKVSPFRANLSMGRNAGLEPTGSQMALSMRVKCKGVR